MAPICHYFQCRIPCLQDVDLSVGFTMDQSIESSASPLGRVTVLHFAGFSASKHSLKSTFSTFSKLSQCACVVNAANVAGGYEKPSNSPVGGGGTAMTTYGKCKK